MKKVSLVVIVLGCLLALAACDVPIDVSAALQSDSGLPQECEARLLDPETLEEIDATHSDSSPFLANFIAGRPYGQFQIRIDCEGFRSYLSRPFEVSGEGYLGAELGKITLIPEERE